MQDVNRIPDVETLPAPSGRRAARANDQTLHIVPCSEHAIGVVRDSSRERHFGQDLTVGAAEAKLAVRPSNGSIAFLVNRPVMPATE